MLLLLVLLVAAQAPAVPGEGTLVSFCKQGRLAACEELAKINLGKATEIQAELAKAALRKEALRIAEEGAQEKEEARADESSETEASEAEASDEPPNCQGQNHHVISRPIAEELERHKTLRGLYKPRDERFVTKAKDKESHCGYQEWHRKVDAELIEWLKAQEKATPELERFPNGFRPAI